MVDALTLTGMEVHEDWKEGLLSETYLLQKKTAEN